MNKLVSDFKSQYLEVNSDSIDEANSKFNSLLQSLNINSDDCLSDDNQINIEDFDENEDLDSQTSNQNTSNLHSNSKLFYILLIYLQVFINYTSTIAI